MELNDLINKLNEVVRVCGGKGHFVVSIQVLPTVVNAYRHVVITLWYIDGEYKKEVLAISDNVKYTKDKKEKALKSLSLDFMRMIFEWLTTDSFKERIGIDGRDEVE